LSRAVAKTVSELWGRAEKVMASSCGIPNFGTEDKSLIRQFWPKRAASFLTKNPRAGAGLPDRVSEATVAAREGKPN